MQEIEGSLGPAGGLFIGATIAGGSHRKMQSFGHARISGMAIGVFDHLPDEVIGRGAQCFERGGFGGAPGGSPGAVPGAPGGGFGGPGGGPGGFGGPPGGGRR